MSEADIKKILARIIADYGADGILVANLGNIIAGRFGHGMWLEHCGPESLTCYLRKNSNFHLYSSERGAAKVCLSEHRGHGFNNTATAPRAAPRPSNSSSAAWCCSRRESGGSTHNHGQQQQFESTQQQQRDEEASRKLVAQLVQEQEAQDKENVGRLLDEQHRQRRQQQLAEDVQRQQERLAEDARRQRQRLVEQQRRRQQLISEEEQWQQRMAEDERQWQQQQRQMAEEQRRQRQRLADEQRQHTLRRDSALAEQMQQSEEQQQAETQALIAQFQRENENDALSATLRREQERKEREEAQNTRLVLELQREEEQEAADARMAASLVQQTFECPICLEERPNEDVFIVERCDHEVCRFCMAHHILSEVTTRNVPTRCAVCISMTPDDITELNEMEAKSLLTDEQIERYDHTSLRNAVDRTTALHTCNEPDCHGVAELDGDYVRFQCPVCTVERCVHCNVGWHDGQTCEQYQEWQTNNEAGDELLAGLQAAGEFKACYQCGAGVQKSEGCNHMTCTCGAHFCYLCSAELPANDPYTHFNSGCQLFVGGVYDEVN